MADDTTNQDATVATETQPDKSAGTTPTDAKFSQTDLDRVAGETRAKAKQVERDTILKVLGVDKLEDAEALLKAHRARTEADKTEAQKVEEAKLKAEKERDDALAALTAAQTERLIERRNGIVEKAAAAALAKVAEDVVTWAEKYAPDDLAKIVGEDGKQDEKALTGLIEACKTARPDWFGKPRSTAPGTPSNAGGSVIDGEDKAAREANFRRMRRNV